MADLNFPKDRTELNPPGTGDLQTGDTYSAGGTVWVYDKDTGAWGSGAGASLTDLYLSKVSDDIANGKITLQGGAKLPAITNASGLATDAEGNIIAGLGGDGEEPLWQANDTSLYPTDLGLNVGIGTSTPSDKLSVAGTVLTETIVFTANQDRPYLIAGTTTYDGSTTNWGSYGFQHRFKSDGSGVPRVTIDSSDGEVFCCTRDSVGIGTSSPETALDVKLSDTGNTVRVQIGRNDLPYTTYRSDSGSYVHVGYNKTLNGLAFSQGTNPESNDPLMLVHRGGLVGIGTSDPKQPLDVNGNIRVVGKLVNVQEILGYEGNLTIQTPSSSTANYDLILRGNSNSGGNGGKVILGNSARGVIEFYSKQTNSAYRFFAPGQAANSGRLKFDEITTNRTYTFPDATGTIALTSDLPDGTDFVTIDTTQTITGAKTFRSVTTFDKNSTDSIKVNKQGTNNYCGLTFSEAGDPRYLLYLNNAADASLTLQARKNGSNFKTVFTVGLDGKPNFVSGLTGNLTGNADTATKADQIERNGITSSQNSSYRVLLGPNSNSAGYGKTYVVTDRTDLTYNPSNRTLAGLAQVNATASRATVLETSRTLWGRSFDGSSNVSGNITSANNVTGADANMTIQPADSSTNRSLILRGNSTSGNGGGVTIGNSARGTIVFYTGTASTGYRFHKSGQSTIHGRLNFDNMTGTRAFAFPDENGTLALDKNTVNLTGNQTVNGEKTFNNHLKVSSRLTQDTSGGYISAQGTTGMYAFVDRKTITSAIDHIGLDCGAYPLTSNVSWTGVLCKPLWTISGQADFPSGSTVKYIRGISLNAALAPAGATYANVQKSHGIYSAMSRQSGREVLVINCTGNAGSVIPDITFRSLSFQTPQWFNERWEENEVDENGVAIARTAEEMHVQDTAESVGTGLYMNAEGNICFARAGVCVLELGNGQVIGNLLDKIQNLQDRLAAIESNEVADDATDTLLLTTVADLINRVTALEGA